MNCPLCQTPLKQHLIQSNISLVACPEESCIYPFNLSITQLKLMGLLFETNTASIMEAMKLKFKDANVDSRIAQFICKPDTDVMLQPTQNGP